MRVLSIVHQPDAGPGVFAEQIRSRSVHLDTWAIADGDDPPEDPQTYDAVMTFGGAMHADQDDRHPWLLREKALLADLTERGTPVLGACLGAQVLCGAVGGQVRRLPSPEIGWLEVEVTPEGSADPLLAAVAPGFRAFQWHSYECVPPAGATVLAHSEACVQAFRFGEGAVGIQFHAEVSHEDLSSWIDDWRSDEDAIRIGLDAEALREETEAAIGPWNDLGRSLCGRFLDAVATRV